MISGSRTELPRLTTSQRRTAIRCAYANGGLWGIGNGLVGSTLIFYLAKSYGATGLALSLLIASPNLIGLLRLIAPMLMDRVGSRRRFCVQTFLASSAVLLVLPVISAPGLLPSKWYSLSALVFCWSTYHLLEYLGVVALWSWFGDLVPRQVRGRFVGVRSSWLNAGRICGASIGIAINGRWGAYCLQHNLVDQKWLGYSACIFAGALLLALAVLPLARMADVLSPSGVGNQTPQVRLREMLIPLADANFRRFLQYGIWFSFSNGITSTALRVYRISILNISYVEQQLLDYTSRGTQVLVMPWVGKQIDRRGNVPMLFVSQGLVAAALLFFLIASPEHRWWIIGAYILWIAYAGTNVAMPNLMLQLSQPECAAAYAAAWFATTQLVYSLSIIAGGMLFDWMAGSFTPWHGDTHWGTWQVDHFVVLIAAGWLLRSLGMVWILRIREAK